MFKLTFILFTLLLLCCKEADTKAISWDTATTITIKDLISLLGKSLDSLPDINGYEKEKKEIKDTFEIEFITGNQTYINTFFRVEYKSQNKLIFVVESDILKIEQNDGSVIERKVIVDSLMNKITLFSDEIKEGDVYVGQTFKNVRNLVKDKFVTTESEMFAILYEYPEITIGFDVSKIPSKDSLYLKYRIIDSLMKIPDSSKIKSIDINKRYQDIVLLPDEVKSIELSDVSPYEYYLWGDGNISLDSNKKISFLEDLNKLQFSLFTKYSYFLCYEIKICCKNNEEISLEQRGPYNLYDFKKNVLYSSRENLVTKYWDVSKYEYTCNFETYKRVERLEQ